MALRTASTIGASRLVSTAFTHIVKADVLMRPPSVVSSRACSSPMMFPLFDELGFAGVSADIKVVPRRQMPDKVLRIDGTGQLFFRRPRNATNRNIIPPTHPPLASSL